MFAHLRENLQAHVIVGHDCAALASGVQALANSSLDVPCVLV